MLIAFATSSKQLRLVRAVTDWGLPKSNDKTQAQMAKSPFNFSVRTKHLAVTSWLNDVPGEDLPDLEHSMVQLSHLEFLPPSVDSSSRVVYPATILTVRSYLPSPTSFNQEVHTLVDKWEVRDREQAIHPAFEQLSQRRNSVGSQPGVSYSV